VALSNSTVPTDSIEQLVEIVKAIVPGAWAKPSSLGAKVEETAAKLDAGRTKDNAQVTELRGALKIKAGEELKSGETLCTLAEALWPTQARTVDCSSGLAGTTSTGNKLLISTAGVVTVAVAVKSAEEVFLDGLLYAIS
jgi:hypothetical protein